jgi:mono/diheme cytochrome c family protein
VTALSVGLKVDAEALRAAVVEGIRNGSVDLKSPDTSVALLKLDAVVGLKETVESVNGTDTLTRVGVTCALCHSNVDDSFAPGIGKRRDGWPNRNLNPGAIIALSPALGTAAKAAYNSWGPGKYDPRFNVDGVNGPQVIPYGLKNIHRITSTGDGDDIAYWNRYVAVTQMGGHASFSERRTGVNVTNGTDDLVTSKLPALQAYQLTLAAPSPPPGSFDQAAVERGRVVFNGAGQCVGCHSGPEYTDANLRLHPPADVVSEPEPNGAPSWASRSAPRQYRTAPLRGVWAARALFSQWQRSDAGGCRADLQYPQGSRADRRPDCGSRAVSEVAVAGAGPCGWVEAAHRRPSAATFDTKVAVDEGRSRATMPVGAAAGRW